MRYSWSDMQYKKRWIATALKTRKHRPVSLPILPVPKQYATCTSGTYTQAYLAFRNRS